MRKLIFAINITLDGCCDHTKGIVDGELHGHYTELLRGVDTIVYGRKTYELMVPFWPDVAKDPSGHDRSMIDFAEAFDAVGKIVVFSRTLGDQAENIKTAIARLPLRDEILKLKQEPGKDILTGGVDVPSQLIELDLIDEYQFVVHPVVAGEGRRLLMGTTLPEKLQLKLVESKTFASGCVAHRYLKQ